MRTFDDQVAVATIVGLALGVLSIVDVDAFLPRQAQVHQVVSEVEDGADRARRLYRMARSAYDTVEMRTIWHSKALRRELEVALGR